MLERPDIAELRHRYLSKIKKYREARKKIIYTVETWVNLGHVSSKSWQDITVKSARDAFLKGLSTGLKNPSGKGERLLVTHAGGDNEFVPNAELIFKGSNSSGDYHKEMNSDVYELWFEEQLLPNIPENSVIVLDHYNTVIVIKLLLFDLTKVQKLNWCLVEVGKRKISKTGWLPNK